MELSPRVNALLGALSLAPLLIALSYLPAHLIGETVIFSGSLIIPFVLMGGGFYCAVAFFLFGLARSSIIGTHEKLAWAIGLIFVGVIAAPAFWIIYFSRGRSL